MMKSIKDIFLKGKPSIIKVIIMIAAGLLTEVFASYALTLILDSIPGATDSYLQTIDGLLTMTPKMILTVCLLAPILEEAIFRGLIFGISLRFLPFIIANIIQAVLFGIYHGNPVQGIYAFILGMFIGYLMHVAGGLLYTMIFHASLNIAGLFLIGIIEEHTSYQMQTALAVISLLIIVISVWFLNRHADSK